MDEPAAGERRDGAPRGTANVAGERREVAPRGTADVAGERREGVPRGTADVAGERREGAPRGVSLRRMAAFVKARWWFVLLAPAIMVFGTVVHEAAHAAAAVAQGATVTDVDVLPTLIDGHVLFGQVQYRGDVAVPWAVSLAPALAWTVIAVATALALRRARPGRAAELAFLVFLVLPLVDVAMGAGGLFAGVARSDFHVSLAGHAVETALVLAAYFTVFGLVAWRLFRRLAPGALGPAEFTLGYVALLAAPMLRW